MNPEVAGETTVVNVRTDEWDVYIGRPGKGMDGYFGNPFTSGTKTENIQNYRIMFYDKIEADPEFKRRVLELKGLRLGCFCAPAPCHGDVIAEYLNNL